MSSSSPTLRILPLGGLGEIGMNCTVFEYGEDIFVLDCGILFSDLEQFGVEFVIPDFTYLKERKDRVRAIIVTHGHEDHIGAIPFAIKAGIQAPVYATPFTALMIEEKLKEYAFHDAPPIHAFEQGDCIDLGAFKINVVAVNHSVVDAASLFIDTPIGRIVHTGDFKIDPTPFFGAPIDLEKFKKAGDEGVLLLLSDSTNVEQSEPSLSESIIYDKFEKYFSSAEGLTIVSMFSSNVGRIGQVLTLARKLGKRVVLSGRSMETNVRLGAKAGYLKDVDGLLIPLDDLEKYPRKDVIVLSTGSQGEYRSALIRVSAGEHRQIQIKPGDLVLMSSKFIPGNEKAIGRMINNLFKLGAEVLYESVHDIHVSGHATRPELKKMLELVRPKFFMPVHGEYRHLVHHSKLAKETGIPASNIVIAVNGDLLELTSDSFGVKEHFEEQRVLVESREGTDIDKVVLKDRRQLGETGVVFALILRNIDNGKLISDPQIIAKGIANEELAEELIEEARDVVERVVDDYEDSRSKGEPAADLQELIRIELRRFFKANVSKKPVVIPLVLDL